MGPVHLRKTKVELERRRRELVDRLGRADAAIAAAGAEREVEFGDEAQAAEVVTELGVLGEAERAELGRIEAALARIEAGSYGNCRSCGERIAARRLAALPLALDCADCASAAERAARR